MENTVVTLGRSPDVIEIDSDDDEPLGTMENTVVRLPTSPDVIEINSDDDEPSGTMENTVVRLPTSPDVIEINSDDDEPSVTTENTVVTLPTSTEVTKIDTDKHEPLVITENTVVTLPTSTEVTKIDTALVTMENTVVTSPTSTEVTDIDTDKRESLATMENADVPSPEDTDFSVKREPLDDLLAEMSKLLEPKWEKKHFNRALFTDIKEITELRREHGQYVIDNYIPEHMMKNSLHPVKFVLFVGRVLRVKTIDGKRWFEIEDETGRIPVVENRESENNCGMYNHLHKNFRDIEKKYEASKTHTPDEEFALNVAGARWLLARRRKDISVVPKLGPEHFVGNPMMVIGKPSKKYGKPCVYMIKYVLMDEEQEKWVKKNRDVGRWYEKLFKAKKENK